MKSNEELKEVLKGEDVERIKSATEATMQVFQRIGQAMYQHTQAQARPEQAAAGGAPEGGEEDVVEGEVVDEGGAS
jgi:molecular chaperone DnaK